MKKIILVAVDSNYAIGNRGHVPWRGHQRADMIRFKQITMGFPLIVGRKTYESFPKRPLSGRMNIVITRQTGYDEFGCIPTGSIDDALHIAEKEGKDRVFIIGGAEIYKQMLPDCDELNLTMIHHEFEADTFLNLRRLPQGFFSWKQTYNEYHSADNDNRYPYSFMIFERLTP